LVFETEEKIAVLSFFSTGPKWNVTKELTADILV
jgi:hypothetical protein